MNKLKNMKKRWLGLILGMLLVPVFLLLLFWVAVYPLIILPLILLCAGALAGYTLGKEYE